MLTSRTSLFKHYTNIALRDMYEPSETTSRSPSPSRYLAAGGFCPMCWMHAAYETFARHLTSRQIHAVACHLAEWRGFVPEILRGLPEVNR